MKERAELDAENNDADGDGVTDYDEQYLYKTDPRNPFTGGGTLTDGERILLGLNPKDSSTKPVTVESPKKAGEVAKGLFTIETVELIQGDSGDLAFVPPKHIRVQGVAQPFSFVTLYVYSTPIVVTVRADENGKFEYLFDETLENGEHELFVASVNTTGKILAKSESFPFVKTAEAIEYTPVIAVHMADPVDTSMQTFITFILILTILVVISAVVWIGVYKSHHPQGAGLVDMNEEDEL